MKLPGRFLLVAVAFVAGAFWAGMPVQKNTITTLSVNDNAIITMSQTGLRIDSIVLLQQDVLDYSMPLITGTFEQVDEYLGELTMRDAQSGGVQAKLSQQFVADARFRLKLAANSHRGEPMALHLTFEHGGYRQQLCAITVDESPDHKILLSSRLGRVSLVMPKLSSLVHEAAHCRGHWLMDKPSSNDWHQRVNAIQDQFYAAYGRRRHTDLLINQYVEQMEEAFADVLTLMVIAKHAPEFYQKGLDQMIDFRTWAMILGNDVEHFTVNALNALSQTQPQDWVEFGPEARDLFVLDLVLDSMPKDALTWERAMQFEREQLALLRPTGTGARKTLRLRDFLLRQVAYSPDKNGDPWLEISYGLGAL